MFQKVGVRFVASPRKRGGHKVPVANPPTLYLLLPVHLQILVLRRLRLSRLLRSQVLSKTPLLVHLLAACLHFWLSLASVVLMRIMRLWHRSKGKRFESKLAMRSQALQKILFLRLKSRQQLPKRLLQFPLPSQQAAQKQLWNNRQRCRRSNRKPQHLKLPSLLPRLYKSRRHLLQHL